MAGDAFADAVRESSGTGADSAAADDDGWDF
jgi:hypothetical protein